jgi:hypothetical protein
MGNNGGEEGIPPNDARAIAIHATSRGHRIPGIDINSSNNVWLYEEYVYRASRKQNIQGQDQLANFAGPQIRKKDGARAWYDYERDAIIIHNPSAGNKGTVCSAPDAYTDWRDFPDSDVFAYEQ